MVKKARRGCSTCERLRAQLRERLKQLLPKTKEKQP